jgi:hypothetical protein
VPQRIDVDAVADFAHAGLGDLCRLFDQVGAVGLQRLLVHPHHRGVKAPGCVRQVAGKRQHVAAADVDLVLQAQGDRQGANASSNSPSQATMDFTRLVRPDGRTVMASPRIRRGGGSVDVQHAWRHGGPEGDCWGAGGIQAVSE